MNPELWKLLSANNNCLVSTSNRTNKNTKQIDQLKAEFCSFGRRLTKNILGDGTSGPTDGQEGGIEQRPCPANGDEWVDPVTGARYIFQDCAWHLVPCCTQFTGPTGVDLVSVYENGVMAPFRLVAAPGLTGKYIWCQTGAAGEIGEWVNEDLHDASNFLGTGPTGTPMSGIQLNGMTRPPIDGDQWYNIIPIGGAGQISSSYIYKNGGWTEVPCCVGLIPGVDDDIVTIRIAENTSFDVVIPPVNTGTFIWQNDGVNFAGWTASSNYDAANFIGATGVTAGEVPPPGVQLDGMTRPPINGDQWYNILDAGFPTERSVDYIYKNGGWTGVPCCVSSSQFNPDLIGIFIENTAFLVVEPPQNTGSFIWQSEGGNLQGWTASSNYDAANFIGATGVTAGEVPPPGVQLDGMTRPPINGDQWYNILDAGFPTERSVDYIYKNGGWTGVPCCVAILPIFATNYTDIYIGNNSFSSFVNPPTTTGTFVWVSDLFEGWQPSSNYDAANFIGATGVTAGTIPNGVQLDGMTRPPINGDQWYNIINGGGAFERSSSYIYKNDGWTGVPCCVGFSEIVSSPPSDLGNLIIGENNGNIIVLPPGQTGQFIWNQVDNNIGSWTAASNYDAANFIGVGASGLTAGSLPPGALDGMTRPPINGDQWYNILDAGTTAERSVDYIYKNDGWTGVPCCVAYDDPCVVTNNVGTLYVGEDPAHKVVQPPMENTGTYLWQQNVTGSASEGVWVPASSPFFSAFVELIMYGISGTVGPTGVPFGTVSNPDGVYTFNSLTGEVTVPINGQYIIDLNLLYEITLSGALTTYPFSTYGLGSTLYVGGSINSSAPQMLTQKIYVPGEAGSQHASYMLSLTAGTTLANIFNVTTSGLTGSFSIIKASMQVKKFIQP